jgi:hypothetical protein
MAWAFEIAVDDPATQVAAGYTIIRIYRSTTGPTGTFSLIAPAVTLTLTTDTNLYNAVDATGKASYWYKIAFFGATPGEDTQSAAMYGGMVNYCKVTDLKSVLNDGQASTDDDRLFLRHVQTATSIVSEYCNRHFRAALRNPLFQQSPGAWWPTRL